MNIKKPKILHKNTSLKVSKTAKYDSEDAHFLFVATTLAFIIFGLFNIVRVFQNTYSIRFFSNLAIILICVAVVIFVRRYKRTDIAGFILKLGLFLNLFSYFLIAEAKLEYYSAIAFLVFPVISVYLNKKRDAFLWSSTFLILIFIFTVISITGAVRLIHELGYYIILLATYIGIYSLLYVYDIKVTKSNERLIYQLYNDTLTGLPNRFSLIKDLSEQNYQQMILLNIDRFKDINDVYGNLVGDFIIKSIAGALQKVTKSKNIIIYKLHADEFALVICDRMKSEKLALFCKKLANSNNLKRFKYLNLDISVRFTIGVATSDNNLLEKTDVALRHAKLYNIRYVMYDESLSMLKKLENNLLIGKEIEIALEKDRFLLYFQPIINNKTNKVEKYECLIRMRNSEDIILTPDLFLDIAKKTNFYPQLTRLVVKKAIEVIKRYKVNLSVNLSSIDLNDIETQKFLINSIKKAKVGRFLDIEILESEEIEDLDALVNFLKDLKKLKCKIALDDFGSGYSNWGYLPILKLNYIKIDQSLIKDICHNKSAELIVKSIVRFSNQLGVATVAEYVSDRDIYKKIKKIGVNFSQGYYFGRPEEYFMKKPD